MRITKRLEIDAGHRLCNHESKCSNLHGHRYAIEVTCELLGDLDRIGRVVDFSVIKAVFGKWLDDNVDHAFIVHDIDPLREAIMADGGRVVVVDFSPTAENLAAWFIDRAAALLDCDRFRVCAMTVHETPTCFATVTR